MNTLPFREHDYVRIIAVSPREFDGSRAPQIGDRGTIVSTADPESSGSLVVQCVGQDRGVLWLAAFQPTELVLVHRPSEDIPEWLGPGAIVHHTHFGRGEVEGHGEHKGIAAVRIQFDSVGRKALSTEIALSTLSPVPASKPSLVARVRERWRRPRS